MRIKWLFVLLTFLILTPATAQDETPLPILHAEDIFAEGVTVLERLPVLNYDNEARELYYFDPEKMVWETIPYPRSFDAIDFVTNYDEENLYRIQLTDDERTRSDEHLFLDVETGEFYEAILLCENTFIPYDILEWNYVSDGVCHYPSNETLRLPTEINAINDAFAPYNPVPEQNHCILSQAYPSQSPNGEYLLLPVCLETEHYIYRYNFNDFSTELVFSQMPSDGIKILAWYDNQFAYVEAIYQHTGGDVTYSLFLLDTDTGNAEPLFEHMGYRSLFWVADKTEWSYVAYYVQDNVLTFVTYEFSSQTPNTAIEVNCDDIPYDCSSFINIESVSDNGLYIVVSGYTKDDEALEVFVFSSPRNEIIYTSNASMSFGRQPRWIDEQTFYWYEAATNVGGNYPLRILKFDNSSNFLNSKLEYLITYSPDGRYLISQEDESLFVLDTETSIKTLLATIPEEMNFWIYSDDSLALDLNDKETGKLLAKWLIELGSDNS